jgi:hypothetical protein
LLCTYSLIDQESIISVVVDVDQDKVVKSEIFSLNSFNDSHVFFAELITLFHCSTFSWITFFVVLMLQLISLATFFALSIISSQDLICNKFSETLSAQDFKPLIFKLNSRIQISVAILST